MTLGSLLPDLKDPPPGPASRALAARLRAVESRNVTFVSDDWPIFWEEAAGSNVRDADGNVYLDLTAAFGVALLGHAHPAVVAAVERQARRLVHGMGDVHPPTVKVELLERLSGLGPWPEGVAVLASTGSEAVEIALKTALLVTEKPGLLAFEGGYHGLTLGSLAATARADFREPFASRLYQGVAFAPFPTTPGAGVASVEASLERVRALLRDGAPNGDPIGAVLVEPVQGRAGARVAPDGFMSELSAAAAEADALVVADEILTGLGRAGAMLGSERVGLRPDLVCFGKSLGAGMPISACVGPRAVMDAWPPSEGEALHTSTFLGHPLSCAAAVAGLDVTAAESVPARADALGETLLAALGERLSEIPRVAEVRGTGLLIAVELLAADGVSPSPGAGARVARRALERGVIVLPAGDAGHVVQLTPSVSLTHRQVERGVELLVDAVFEEVG